MNNEDKLFDILALMQNSIDETKNVQKDILNKINSLNTKLESNVSEIKSDINELKIETNTINHKLDSLVADFRFVEQMSAKNYADVSMLKNAK